MIGLLVGGLIQALRASQAMQTERVARAQAEESSLQARRQLEQLQSEREGREQKVLELTGTLSRFGAERLAMEEKLETREKEFISLQERMREQFQNLANEILESKSKRFTEQNQENIQGLITPIRESLELYQTKLGLSEKAQAEVLGQVREQMEQLRTGNQALSQETEQLRHILKSSAARGRWGEATLRRVVEVAGMSPHCDFEEQSSGAEGKPDLVVRLPEGRKIIIDSKMPDIEWVRHLDSTDPVARQEAIQRHAKVVSETVRLLAQREYHKMEGSLDYVVCFLPAESIFSAALEGDPDLILSAARQNIILTTPSSLIALLRGVQLSWQYYQQTQQVHEIAKAARDLYSKVTVFMEHFAEVGAGLERASRGFNKAVGSYQRSVKPVGKRLVELGSDASGKELPDIEPVNDQLRTDELKLL